MTVQDEATALAKSPMHEARVLPAGTIVTMAGFPVILTAATRAESRNWRLIDEMSLARAEEAEREADKAAWDGYEPV